MKRPRAELILTSYAQLGYRSVAVGANKLPRGRDLIVRLMEQYPLVAGNIAIGGAAGQPIVVERNSVRIGIFSLRPRSLF